MITFSLLADEDVLFNKNPLTAAQASYLRRRLGILAGLDASGWGRYAFARERLSSRLAAPTRETLAAKARTCGLNYAQELVAEFATRAPGRLAEALGMRVSRDTVASACDFGMTVAHLIHPGAVVIYCDGLEKGEEWLEKSGTMALLNGNSLEDVVLAHEIFHFLEERDGERVFTRREKLELWNWPFSFRTPLGCLGEIAAMAFAESMLGLPRSPFILDLVFMHAYSPEGAAELYEFILESAKESSHV